MGNNLVLTMPKSAIWVTGFLEGEVLEIEVKGENMIIARKFDNVRYSDSRDLNVGVRKPMTKETLIS